MNNPELPFLDGAMYWPLSNHTWLQTLEESKLSIISTETLFQQDADWSNLRHFNQLTLKIVTLILAKASLTAEQRLREKAFTNQKIVGDALTHLAAPLAPPEEQALLAMDEEEPLLQACRLVGAQMDLDIKPIPESRRGQTATKPVEEVAKVSRFRIRRVALKGNWYRQDYGPLLAFLEENKQPVALLPSSGQKYELHDPVAHTKTTVTEKVAEKFDYFAYSFYRPFPTTAVNAWQLLKFGMRDQAKELRVILSTGVLVGVLALLIPVATGVIIDRIIPTAERNQLIQLSLALFVIALASAMFQITQNIAVLRLRGKLSMSVQAAIWDRLLTLPVSFFRHYTAGDLGSRMMGVNAIEQTLSEPIIGAILSGLFSTFSFFLLFYYSPPLAWIATILGIVLMATTIITARIQIRYQREIAGLRGQISGVVLQAITGIAKFRAAGAEGKAFAFWAKDFSKLKQISFRARAAANNLLVFNSGYYVIMLMMIFGMIAFSSQQNLSAGTFLAFNAAFVQFFTAIFLLSTTLIAILGILPNFERLQPVLQMLPEVDELKTHPGELIGAIEVSHLSFRYQEDGPQVLKDVCLQASPGEFIALVGPSGSGKSTLLRLLLGFESPLSGAIYYDNHDLESLDIREVRRQMGVVLQTGQLMTGDIYTNIVGSSLLTLDDAWEAVRMAGMEEDIKQMPMGLYTVLSAGGETLSGGQRQRLLIARAIVHKPRILFFDEATSALDNRTQAIVSDSLEKLQATRVVIAHRLSTIMNAERIYVLQQGQVVESGTYDELMRQEGVFAELAKRQVA